MKKVIQVFIAVVSAAFLAGCGGAGKTGPSGGAQAPSDTAAVVNGVTITVADLDSSAKKQLQRVETEIYQIKKRVLDDLVEQKLIEDAAKKKGLSVEKFITEEVDEKAAAPTEDEIKAIYDSSKDKVGKTFDEVKNQIADYLKQNKKSRARAELIAKLKEGADVKVKLEPPRVAVDIKGAPSIGDKDAKVTLVEFSDYQCPFCKRVRPTIWRLTDEYKGKLLYVYRDFPLSFHKDAKKASEAAVCAGDQDKYFEYNRKLFDNQTAIGVDDLKKYARELGLNTKDFDKCLEGGKHTKDVDASVQAGAEAGVSGTPAYFINGIMLSGALPYESFKEVIDSELAK